MTIAWDGVGARDGNGCLRSEDHDGGGIRLLRSLRRLPRRRVTALVRIWCDTGCGIARRPVTGLVCAAKVWRSLSGLRVGSPDASAGENG